MQFVYFVFVLLLGYYDIHSNFFQICFILRFTVRQEFPVSISYIIHPSTKETQTTTT